MNKASHTKKLTGTQTPSVEELEDTLKLGDPDTKRVIRKTIGHIDNQEKLGEDQIDNLFETVGRLKETDYSKGEYYTISSRRGSEAISNILMSLGINESFVLSAVRGYLQANGVTGISSSHGRVDVRSLESGFERLMETYYSFRNSCNPQTYSPSGYMVNAIKESIKK